MGIKLLNSFLRKTCPNALSTITFEELRGKSIAVDTLIYLYRFKSEKNLIENFYTMLLLFRQYDINAYFVFDGSKTEEKQQELLDRKHEKNRIKEEISQLKQKLTDETILEDSKKREIVKNIEELEKTCVSIRHTDIANIKRLIELNGYPIINAPYEADEYCGILCREKKVSGVLTEDMDLFAYGCFNVYRYMSLRKETMICYDIEKILSNLRIDFKTFREMCILSGTDYNTEFKKNNLYNIFTVYRDIHMYMRTNISSLYHYYKFPENTINELEKIHNMFNLTDKSADSFVETTYSTLRFVELKDFLRSFNFY